MEEITVAVVPDLPIDFLISCKDQSSLAGVMLGNSSLPVMTRFQMRSQIQLEQESGNGPAEKQGGNGPASA